MSDMIQITTRKTENFKTIDLYPIQEDVSLSWKAKGLHTYLITRPPGWKIRYTDLVKRASDGRAALKAAIGELKQAGYLTIKRQRRADGTFGDSVWTVTENPKKLDILGNSPEVENPQVDNPQVDNPQGSKNEFNNEKNKKKKLASYDIFNSSQPENHLTPSEWKAKMLHPHDDVHKAVERLKRFVTFDENECYRVAVELYNTFVDQHTLVEELPGDISEFSHKVADHPGGDKLSDPGEVYRRLKGWIAKSRDWRDIEGLPPLREWYCETCEEERRGRPNLVNGRWGLVCGVCAETVPITPTEEEKSGRNTYAAKRPAMAGE